MAGAVSTFGGRLRSLDVFRGATVALMILVNNPGNWGALYPPLAHAPWHGATPTDLVFPFFLFAVGNALALVMPGLRAAGAAVFWQRILKRTLLIFAIGLLLNAAPFVRWDAAGELVLREGHTLRLMGVLQRISLCFGAAAAIVWWLGRRSDKPVLWAAATLLLGYWLACETLGTQGDVYSLQGWFGTAVDRALLGESHLYRGEGGPFDPEGLASTAPAMAQVLLGWWVGRQVAQGRVDTALLLRLFLAATALAVLAYVWQLQVPINKKIWTPSYVLLTTALAMATLALCLHRLEPLAPQGAPGEAPALPLWARFFEVFGKNPLFVFVLSGLVPRALGLLRWQTGVDAQGAALWTSPLPWAYQHLFAGMASDPRLGSFLFAATNLLAYAALAWWLDRRRIYIRV
jgi:predicted acyltransferase